MKAAPCAWATSRTRSNIDLSGIRQLGLLVTDRIGGVGNKRTYCNWADAKLEMNGEASPGRQPNDGERYLLTPPLSAALHRSGREDVFSLPNNTPFKKVANWARVANMYQTGPDIRDSSTSLYLTTFDLDKWAPHAGPGHWGDPDMMVLGKVSTGTTLHPTRPTPDEQHSHVSMFCLLSAPLLIGCPLEQLDAFTLALLTNNKLIAINQDPLGRRPGGSPSATVSRSGKNRWRMALWLQAC